MIERSYRDRAVAEAVCRGRFTHAGITLELGLEPDWLGAQLPADEEWRIDWVKFYYGLDLAHAYRRTGDGRFRRAFERLVRSWIEQVEPAHDPSEVTARRISNWVYAWCSFESAPGFGGFAHGLEDELLPSLEAQARHVRRNLTPARNHRTLELYSLLVLALALPDLDPDGSLLELALEGLQRNMLSDVREDGVHCEASTHYHMVVLRSALGTRENARRFELRLSGAFDERLERACEFALHCHRPDGQIAMLSDSDAGSYRDLLELGSSLLGRPDLLYAATAAARGMAPRALCPSFPDGGYHVQRSGWGEGARAFEDELFLIFDCGPVGEGGHGHYDLLSIEAAGGGRPLLIDPGRFTYSEEQPNLRRWFKGTAAHNTVCVDGRDQTPYRRGKPRGPVAQGRLLERLTGPGFDLLRGEARSPRYDAVHERAVALVAGEYWLIVDRLRARDPHAYDLRLHLSPEAAGATRVLRGAENTVVRAPGVALAFPGATGPRLLDGWHAPAYGVKLPAPVVSVVAEGVADHDFHTVVAPLASETARAPALRVLAAPGPGATLVEVVGAGGESRDLIAWSASAASFELGEVRCRGRAAWLRERPHGRPTSLLAFGASEAAWTATGALVPLTGGTEDWALWGAGS
ncbi:MAG: alginate lyase family protein [Solirubrobacterales bacterium]